MKKISVSIFVLFFLVIGNITTNARTFSKPTKHCLMWIDATANFERFSNPDSIDFYLKKIKELGFTDAVVDMRPITGQVLYKSKYAPLLKEWNGKKRDENFDYLGHFIAESHKLGLRVHASLNTFVAGDNFINTGAVYENHPEWASILYTPEKGLVSITTQKKKYSAMVNPINEEYQEYILNIFEEIVKVYPKLDGIILDRVRYDGVEADFSELSKQKFEKYLGEKIDVFPDDIYKWEKDGKGNFYPKRGKYYTQWIEWRSKNIYDFMVRAKARVKSANPKISFGDYTGAWYPTYFEVGVNFASKDYDPSKDYDWATPNYKNTGYAELLDLYAVGNYYTTITKEDYLKNNPAVKNETDIKANKSLWYCVEGSCENLRNILGKNQFLGGILVDQFYNDPDGLSKTIEMNLRKSDGLMVFDIVHIIHKDMWKSVEKGMRDGGAIK
jgi:uncharacterized lipoprotein YddW (UPF0748 family)